MHDSRTGASTMSDPELFGLQVAGEEDLPNSTELPGEPGNGFEPSYAFNFATASPDTLQQNFHRSFKGDTQSEMLSTKHLGLQGSPNDQYNDSDDAATEDSHDRTSKEPSPDDETIRSESEAFFANPTGNGFSPSHDFLKRDSTLSPTEFPSHAQSPFNNSMSSPQGLQFSNGPNSDMGDFFEFFKSDGMEQFNNMSHTIDPSTLMNNGSSQAPPSAQAHAQAHKRQVSRNSHSKNKSSKARNTSASHSPVFHTGNGFPGLATPMAASGAPTKPHIQNTASEAYGAFSGSNAIPNGLVGQMSNGYHPPSANFTFGTIAPNMQFQQQQISPYPIPQPPAMRQPRLIVQVNQEKSRVETQLKFTLVFNNEFREYSRIHLPTKKISKPKLVAKSPHKPSPNTLELCVTVVCTSAMQKPELKAAALQRACASAQDDLPPDNTDYPSQEGHDVRICQGCILRERKRASRKKVKNQDDEDAWLDGEEHRVVVFNCLENRDLEPMDESEGLLGSKIDLPMRIACYCRHHSEKMGFQVIFTFKDMHGRVVAQEMSKPIMITDDHKNSVTQPMAVAEVVDGEIILDQGDQSGNMSQPGLNGFSHSNGSDAAMGSTGGTPPARSRTTSRPSSPTRGGPSKKRKSSASATKIPNSLAMTRMDVSSPQQDMSLSDPFGALNGNNAPDASALYTSPGNTNGNINGMANGMANGMTNGNINGSALNQPPTPGINEQNRFFGNQYFSAPGSNFSSRAASPDAMRNGNMQTPPQNVQQSIAQNYQRLSSATGMGVGDLPPVLTQAIPNSGSKSGGTRVSVLGSNLRPGMVIHFGTFKAMNTEFYSDSVLISTAPPSPVTGWVPVTIGGQTSSANGQTVWFEYKDDIDQNLMATTIALLSGKLSGNGQASNMNDATQNVMNAIVGRGGLGGAGGANGGMNGHANGPTDGLENQIIKCLEFIDEDDSPYESDLDLQNSSGHTILHLASMQGYRRLVAALLARGANPNERDNCGCTPLHLAAIDGRAEVAKTLVQAGSSVLIQNKAGMLPIHLSKNGAVKDAIEFSEPRRPSHGGGDLAHSRVSSVSSLRSLRELSRMSSRQQMPVSVHDDEESLEYTSGDFEDEDPDEDIYMHMRRPSGLRQDLPRKTPEAIASDDVTHASAMTAALKEHFQQQLNQFQQSMALHLQNLPHLPQMPQMPALPGVPFADYQAYLQQAPFMRRMTQYMPGMAGSNPDSQDGSDQKMDHRWWDLSSLMGNSSVPPPAYEELYPQKDMDTKHSSAAQAAADAEADMKCANLYDQEIESTQETEMALETETQVPSVLKIGHKNAITREQQEQFLRAREQKLKKLGNDRKLFFVWIPLLICMIFTMLYSYFPTVFILVWNMLRSFARVSANTITRVWDAPRTNQRVVEL